jgi:NTE family protein
MAKKRVALILGSGGARGYAHIGAIRALQERDHEIVGIAGTSMGALVGGLYAAGTLDDYADWVSALSQRDVLRLMDATPFGAGALRLERVFAKMADMLSGHLIEDFPIPYTAVATDLGARREVWFQSGPVDAAIRASVAIPGAITPVMVNGRLLVDGGLLNPVPVEPLMGVDADYSLAVALSGWTPRDFGSSPAKESSQEQPAHLWLERFRKGAAGIFDNEWVASVMARFTSGKDEDDPTDALTDAAEALEGGPAVPSAEGETADEEALQAGVTSTAHDLAMTDDAPSYAPPPPGLGIAEVTGMALDTMSGLISRFRLAAQPPDLLVTVPGDAAKTMDFHRASELIDLGYALTVEALDEAFAGD